MSALILSPGLLAAALTQWANLTGIQLVFGYDEVGDYPTRGVECRARCDPLEVLTQLLDGTPYSFEVTAKDAVTVTLQPYPPCQPERGRWAPPPPCAPPALHPDRTADHSQGHPSRPPQTGRASHSSRN